MQNARLELARVGITRSKVFFLSPSLFRSIFSGQAVNMRPLHPKRFQKTTHPRRRMMRMQRLLGRFQELELFLRGTVSRKPKHPLLAMRCPGFQKATRDSACPGKHTIKDRPLHFERLLISSGTHAGCKQKHLMMTRVLSGVQDFRR